jgi:uncharacterized protein (TIGR02145 family)
MNTKKSHFLSCSILIAFLLMMQNGCKQKLDVPGIVFNPTVYYGSMTDQDGNTYKTVTIGTQVWMAENLRTTTYRNGDPVPQVTGDVQWVALTTGAECSYYNEEKYVPVFGRLYNWYAVNDSRNIAPEGWHVPSDNEWSTLESFLGDSIAAKKLKESGMTHWLSYPMTHNATNETGFTALPGGFRYEILYDRTFWYMNFYGRWWSTTGSDASKAWSREMYTDDDSVARFESKKLYGYSIRCVKD